MPSQIFYRPFRIFVTTMGKGPNSMKSNKSQNSISTLTVCCVRESKQSQNLIGIVTQKMQVSFVFLLSFHQVLHFYKVVRKSGGFPKLGSY